MLYFPNAKINIGLNVFAKRQSGYHDLKSIMVGVDLCDILELTLVSGERGKCTIAYSGISIPESGRNLCLQAYDLVSAQYDIPSMHLHLHKVIPIGGGLGGGSSDAVVALKAIVEYSGIEVSEALLQKWALSMGADCPFFLKNIPSRVSGVGEKLEPLESHPWKDMWVCLGVPEIHISTQEAFSNLSLSQERAFPDFSISVDWSDPFFRNDFESAIIENYPSIGEGIQRLASEGALFASLSGSGAVYFGIFNEPKTITSLPHQLHWAKIC